MSETGLSVVVTLPFQCRPGTLDAAQRHGALLLLRVANLLDGHEPEPGREHERLEAKLDLMLHWLGQQLFGATPLPTPYSVTLGSSQIRCPGDPLPEGTAVIASLHVHPALTAPLHLPGKVAGHDGELIRLELLIEDDVLADAWTQWLFRQHRRAIHDARGRIDAE